MKFLYHNPITRGVARVMAETVMIPPKQQLTRDRAYTMFWLWAIAGVGFTFESLRVTAQSIDNGLKSEYAYRRWMETVTGGRLLKPIIEGVLSATDLNWPQTAQDFIEHAEEHRAKRATDQLTANIALASVLLSFAENGNLEVDPEIQARLVQQACDP